MFRRLRQTRVGQGLVEFALIAPLFFTLVFGIIEGGILLWNVHTLNNAAKEGARYASVRGDGSTQPDAPATNDTITDYIVTKSTGLDGTKLLATIDAPGGMNDRDEFTVTVTYQYDFILASIFGMPSLPLSADSSDLFWREPDEPETP